jgi:hypothetical protein
VHEAQALPMVPLEPANQSSRSFAVWLSEGCMFRFNRLAALFACGTFFRFTSILRQWRDMLMALMPSARIFTRNGLFFLFFFSDLVSPLSLLHDAHEANTTPNF